MTAEHTAPVLPKGARAGYDGDGGSSSGWVERHRHSWNTKSGLRWYYTHEMFRRIAARLPPGPILELGAGPGFLTEYLGETIAVDIDPSAHARVIADGHRLPFADASFASVVGVDVLHHFARPLDALRECARVLRPGGRIVLAEPWQTPVGGLFYRRLHHEGFFLVPDPWNQILPEGKDPMEGNTAVPWMLLRDGGSELSRNIPTLRLAEMTRFAMLAYLITGGFMRPWGMPAAVVAAIVLFERLMPRAVTGLFAVRAMLVLERTGDTPRR